MSDPHWKNRQLHLRHGPSRSARKRAKNGGTFKIRLRRCARLPALTHLRYFALQLQRFPANPAAAVGHAEIRRSEVRTVRPRSDVIPQHQFLRVRVEIGLPLQIADREAADVVTHERDRNHQRHQAAAIVVDQRQQLAA